MLALEQCEPEQRRRRDPRLPVRRAVRAERPPRRPRPGAATCSFACLAKLQGTGSRAARGASSPHDVILRARRDQLRSSQGSNRNGRSRRGRPNGTNGTTNSHRPRSERQGARHYHRRRELRVSLVQGVQYYKDAAGRPLSSRTHARRPRRLPHLRHRVHRRLRRRQGQGRSRPRRPMSAHPNDTIKFADVPKTGVKVSRGMTHDGLASTSREIVEKADGPTDDVVGILKADRDRRRRQLSPGRL